MKRSVLLLLLAGCASSNAVDMNEPRRIVGTENMVRVDAQVIGEEARPGAQIPITYEITNQRSTPIAVADLIPDTSFDPETLTFTVSIGTEVPGNATLPRLIEIAPGEKKMFSTAARIIAVIPPRSADPRRSPPPAQFRLRINFLGDTEPFRQLIGIPERAVMDPRLADQLFPLWVERNEVVFTNAIPLRWVARRSEFAPSELPQRRRGRW